MPAIEHIRNFELSIGATDGEYIAQVLSAPAGQAQSFFAYPFSSQEMAHLFEMAPIEVGSRLFDALFTGDVLVCLRTSQARVGKEGGLRINLRLPNAPELGTLPWEMLYDTTHKHFLALSETSSINRYLPLPLADESLAVEPPLRILALLSSPTDYQPQLDVEKEWEQIGKAISPITEQGVAALERLEQATWPQLQSYLRQSAVHILHFIGHGFYDHRSENGGLLFEDEDKFAHLVTTQRLIHLLRNHPSLRLVVLNACQGATASADNPFTGVAQALVQQGIPAVIAMQREISEGAAHIFGETIYAAIADGYPIDAALTQARLAIYGDDDLEWATPVLFMRAPDGHLFKFSGQSETPKPLPLVLPPPLESTSLPRLGNFLGREAELASFADQLRRDGMAIIAGMAGVGKTALAIKLAEQMGSPQTTFWHTFHPGESIHALLWKVAGFLYWNKKPALWQMLQGTQQSGSTPPPPAVLVDYVFQMFKEGDYLLCLDDFHLLYDESSDPILQIFVEKLRPFVGVNPLRVIIVSRSTPDFVALSDAPLLRGLTTEDSRQLLEKQGIGLSDELFKELYACTEGNAELLHLAAHALGRANQPEQVIRRLSTSEDIQRFLMTEVDESLDEEERAAMNGVALLLGYPGNRDAIEEALDGRNVLRTLTYLSNRYLLHTVEGEWDREYLQHALVQAFYYELMGRREREDMHRRVAEYYEIEEEDWLRAALHYQRAREDSRAAELATKDLRGAINRGLARTLRQLLENIRLTRLSPSLRLETRIALGDVLAFLGENQSAEEIYTAANSTLDSLEKELSGAKGEWQARICLGLGTLLVHHSPQKALNWLTQGLEVATQGPTRAALYNRLGTLRIGLAEYPAAIDSLQQALDLLPVTPSQLRVNIVSNLGAVYGWIGDASRSEQYNRQALEMATLQHDLYSVLTVTSNIGIEQEIGGSWGLAEENYKKALGLAEELGWRAGQARIHLLLGTLRLHQRNYSLSQSHLETGIALFRQVQNSEILAATLSVLAHLHIQQGQWEAAATALDEAKTLALNGEWDYILPEVYAGMTLLSLGHNALPEALAWAEQSISAAKEQVAVVEEGKGLRVKGQVLAAQNRLDEALILLDESLGILADVDPYEAALTKQELVQVTAGLGETDRSSALAREAETTLRQLNEGVSMRDEESSIGIEKGKAT